LVVSDSLIITPAGEKGETGRDMTGTRETDEIEPPPQVHMLWWDDFNDQFNSHFGHFARIQEQLCSGDF